MRVFKKIFMLKIRKHSISVADPFHFDAAPDPRLRFVEKRIQIRPKMEKNARLFYSFFSFDYPTKLLCYFMNLLFYNALISV